MIQCCEEGLGLLSGPSVDRMEIRTTKEGFLLLLADAADAKGDMSLAEEYDEKLKTV